MISPVESPELEAYVWRKEYAPCLIHLPCAALPALGFWGLLASILLWGYFIKRRRAEYSTAAQLSRNRPRVPAIVADFSGLRDNSVPVMIHVDDGIPYLYALNPDDDGIFALLVN